MVEGEGSGEAERIMADKRRAGRRRSSVLDFALVGNDQLFFLVCQVLSATLLCLSLQRPLPSRGFVAASYPHFLGSTGSLRSLLRDYCLLSEEHVLTIPSFSPARRYTERWHDRTP